MEKKINIKIIIRSILVFIGFFLSSYLQYIPVILFNMDINKIRGNVGIAVKLSLFSNLLFMLILILIYWKELKKEFKTYISKFEENFDYGFKCYIIGLIIMMSSNLILYYVLKSGGANNEHLVQEFIKKAPIIMGLETCLIAPFNEEIVFRKTLHDVFKNKKALFVILSFLLFGGAHVFSSASKLTDYLYIIPYGALGGAFAIAYNKTDSVFTSMVLHILHNTVLFILSVVIL